MTIEMLQFDNQKQMEDWLLNLRRNRLSLDTLGIACGLEVVIRYYKYLRENPPEYVSGEDIIQSTDKSLHYGSLCDFCYKLKEDLTVDLINTVSSGQEVN